ncbi:MAG: protein kinase, partial [Cyanobacteria bacterium SZAS LIN-2]|nr:protein kinase [Cyanobacteria bacterium SZAS LIN-2]
MTDSREKLALSCTFALRNGVLESLDPVAPASSAVRLSAGQVLDSKYEIVGLLGEGGMGAVYKVRHLLLQKDMALKTFRSHSLSAESWQRFQLEARAIARLKHKNIVEVFDFGIAQNDLPYYTMELLEGESLAELLAREQRLAPAEALRIFLQAAEALAHAHRQQIVHRDIKPANIFLQNQKGAARGPGASYLPKIVDFGIAKLVEDASGVSGSQQALTQSGVIFGSPLYMSPEQSLGLPVDSRSDIYSFGCALYETLVGEPPFLEESTLLTLLSHQTKTPRHLTDALPALKLPQRLDSMMVRLLAKNADKRYQTFEDVIAELRYSLEAIQAVPPKSQQLQPLKENAAEEIVARKGGPGNRAVLFASAIGASLLVLATGYHFWGQSWMPHGPAGKSAYSPANAAVGDRPNGGQTSKFPYSKDRDRMLGGMKPFLIGITATKRIFLFPYRSIGKVKDGSAANPRGAFDQIEVSRHGQLYFYAGDECWHTPALFKRFGPEDLFYLQLDTLYDGEWRNEHLKELVGLNALRELNLSGLPSVDNGAVADIGRLKGLQSLDVSHSALDGLGIAELKTLPQLYSLKLNESKNLRPLFRHIASSHLDYGLHHLEVKHSELGDSDVESIAGGFRHLKGLLLSANNIEGPGLEHLKRLKSLQVLALDGNPLTPSALDVLVQMRSLNRIWLSKG